MLNNLRILVLLLALSVAGFAGYSFLSKFNHSSEGEGIYFSKEGVDVEIKNFKLEHKKLGHKDWELKARQALVNRKKGETRMLDVEVIFVNKNDRKFRIFADSGILRNKTNDLDLEGHVRMLVDSTLGRERFSPRSEPPSSQPKP
ncbi:MAG: LPS export ABC transporter periplasmic protein LptC [Nitrospinaceae bacterium]|jgi:LPS export ABC transporter protein LptC|nr:LPS export ABC transporter periplasmic protein LptC [Nitrospinaceae bacterium]|tara:strand:- start:263 stop:697 length:435 start_codon:yes stop_codon:yes gene_type:complete